MSQVIKELLINSRTTGFASPAESYVDKRLDLNELIVNNYYTTFYFRYGGPDIFGIKKGNILVIDKELIPKLGDLIIISEQNLFKVEKYESQDNFWGKITWVLNKL